MNIFTIAFCYQFLIACWPKTNVNNKGGRREKDLPLNAIILKVINAVRVYQLQPGKLPNLHEAAIDFF